MVEVFSLNLIDHHKDVLRQTVFQAGSLLPFQVRVSLLILLLLLLKRQILTSQIGFGIVNFSLTTLSRKHKFSN